MTYSQRHPEMPQYSTAPLVPQPDTMQPPGKPANYSSAYAPPPLPSMQTGGPPPPTPAGSSSIVSNVLVYNVCTNLIYQIARDRCLQAAALGILAS